jgi:hypothetical protein
MPRSSEKPSLTSARDAVRDDPHARFAALLAAVFAFSAGFAAGVVIGALEDGDAAG